MPPEQLLPSPSHDSVLLCAVVVLFALVAVNFRHVIRTAGHNWKTLWSLRKRENVFDELTSSEKPVGVLMAVQFVVYAGIMTYLGATRALHPQPVYSSLAVAAVTGLFGTYYLFQLLAYNLVGYTFGSIDSRRQWLGGFSASQSLAGLVLVVPTLTMLFYPQVSAVMLAIGVTTYIVARLVFIFKGFRIFYVNLGSLFYFILYLCTLEIIPAIFVCRAAVYTVQAIG